jgi:hypothetical protein
VCAVWLLLLIALPFSAPFSTCDLATFLSGTSEQTIGHPVAPHGPVSLDNSATPHVLPHARVTTRQQRMVVAVHAIERGVVGRQVRVGSENSPVARLGSPLVSPLRI